MITEVKKKVYDIARDYDEVISHHAGCSYCEHRCMYYQKVSEYINANVAINKVLDKWAMRGFASKSFDAFLNSELMKKANIQSDFERICVLGYILAQKKDLNDGQRQKYLSDYLRYKKQIKNGGENYGRLFN